MDVLHQLTWRYATKQFDREKKISAQDFGVLLESLRLAPSAYGLQPWKFIVVENLDVRKQLRKYSYNQTQVTDASHFIVLCAKTSLSTDYVDAYIQEMARVREKPVESYTAFRTMIVEDIAERSAKSIREWNSQQVYLALGFVLATSAYMGIDACPLEGFKPKSYDRILGLKEQGLTAVVCVALGYRDANDKTIARKKVRFPAQETFIYT